VSGVIGVRVDVRDVVRALVVLATRSDDDAPPPALAAMFVDQLQVRAVMM
jgi:hypothetical protein